MWDPGERREKSWKRVVARVSEMTVVFFGHRGLLRYILDTCMNMGTNGSLEFHQD